MLKITLRQFEVLGHLKECGVISSGFEGSILRSLERKGLVVQHYNSQPCGIFYTWTLTDRGREIINSDRAVIVLGLGGG